MSENQSREYPLGSMSFATWALVLEADGFVNKIPVTLKNLQTALKGYRTSYDNIGKILKELSPIVEQMESLSQAALNGDVAKARELILEIRQHPLTQSFIDEIAKWLDIEQAARLAISSIHKDMDKGDLGAAVISLAQAETVFSGLGNTLLASAMRDLSLARSKLLSMLYSTAKLAVSKNLMVVARSLFDRMIIVGEDSPLTREIKTLLTPPSSTDADKSDPLNVFLD